MPEPGRVHDTDVGRQTLVAHERTAGQFCLPGVAEPAVKWPLLAKPEWTAAGEIPGVPPTSQLGNIISWNQAASVFSILDLQSWPAEGASISRRTDRRLS